MAVVRFREVDSRVGAVFPGFRTVIIIIIVVVDDVIVIVIVVGVVGVGETAISEVDDFTRLWMLTIVTFVVATFLRALFQTSVVIVAFFGFTASICATLFAPFSATVLEPDLNELSFNYNVSG